MPHGHPQIIMTGSVIAMKKIVVNESIISTRIEKTTLKGSFIGKRMASKKYFIRVT
jgi:hypothetical protein